MTDSAEEETQPERQKADRLSDNIRQRRGDGTPAPKKGAWLPIAEPHEEPPLAPTPKGPIEPKGPSTTQLLHEIQASPSPAPSPLAKTPEELRAERRTRQRAVDRQKLQRDIKQHLDAVAAAPGRRIDPARPVTDVPPVVGPDAEQVEFTPIQQDVSFVRIRFDKRDNRYLYEVLEPRLDETETAALELVRDTLIRTMDGRAALDETNWESYLLDAVDEVILDHSLPVDRVSRRRIQYYVVRDFLGYGPIDVFMRDPLIEDISGDGPNIPVFLFHRQYESIKTNVQFPNEENLDAFVIRLAQRCGKQISIAEPLLDATLPDKSRLQASLSREVTTRGSTFTIRKFRADPLTPPDLVRLGTMSASLAAFFWFAMENGASIIYAGGTASGKTSTLNAVSCFIPPQKKIVSIEDTREINLSHENWIPGLTRTGFSGEVVGGKIAGTIDMYKLLESALRQRPEYLLVGEVRGPEALTLFQAMATGHATYSTLHADSVQSAVYRLENPPINVPRSMLQTLGGIAIQISTRAGDRLVRRIKEVVEIVGIDPETKDLLTNNAFTWDPATDEIRFLGKSHILDEVRERRNLTNEQIDQEWENRTRVIEWMVKVGVRKIQDVVTVISGYYSDPARMLARIREMEAAGGTPPAA